MRRTDVVIAHRYPIVLEGLSFLLGALSDFRIVGSCESSASCVEAIKNFAPDVAIVDPAMPECAELLLCSAHTSQSRLSESRSTHVVFFGSGEDCARVLEAAPATCSIVLEDVEPEALLQFLRRIANADNLSPATSFDPIVSKEERADADRMLATLTDRERQIMRLVSKGLSNKEIGRRLNIADGTISQHLHNIFQKLAISNRTLLAAMAIAQYGRATMDDDKTPGKKCG